METIWVVVGILVVLAFVIMMLYNRLVALRQTRKNAFSDIDVQLKQRFNLIPQLVNTVKGYASHEKEVFENVTQARARVEKTSGDNGERFSAEGLLGGAMMGLFAVAENYPDLKADSTFLQLQSELSDIENKIAAARRFFNSATSEYNTSLQQFPANLIAGMFGFHEEMFFELDEAEAEAIRTAPEVNFS